VRTYRAGDKKQIRSLISNTLLVTNCRDYTLEEIRALGKSYSASTIEAMSNKGRIWVYVEGESVQGVVCLDGDTIQALFVAPDRQGRGIGRILLGVAEASARRRRTRILRVPASLNAVDFYCAQGFRPLGPGRSASGVLIERMSKDLVAD
jgi:GNAT superfamily N-acetyltransferase